MLWLGGFNYLATVAHAMYVIRVFPAHRQFNRTFARDHPVRSANGGDKRYMQPMGMPKDRLGESRAGWISALLSRRTHEWLIHFGFELPHAVIHLRPRTKPCIDAKFEALPVGKTSRPQNCSFLGKAA